MRDAWVNKRKSFLIPSPYEEQKILNAKRCTQEGAREGAKAAAVACVVSAVPTLIAVRFLGQRVILIILLRHLSYLQYSPLLWYFLSTASIAAYFITADKTILECARQNSREEFKRLA